MQPRSAWTAKIRLMAKDGPSYSIEPIEPDEIRPRFEALVDRLEPLLRAPDVASLRSLLAGGEYEAAFGELDAVTNDGTISVDTATLVELVLLGQAIRTS